MPVLKVKDNGVWYQVFTGQNDADTLDGRHASDFASSTDMTNLKNLVGNTSVSTQINNALNDFSSGKTLSEHLQEEMMILKQGLQYGDELPSPGIPGRIFFKKVDV